MWQGAVESRFSASGRRQCCECIARGDVRLVRSVCSDGECGQPTTAPSGAGSRAVAPAAPSICCQMDTPLTVPSVAWVIPMGAGVALVPMLVGKRASSIKTNRLSLLVLIPLVALWGLTIALMSVLLKEGGVLESLSKTSDYAEQHKTAAQFQLGQTYNLYFGLKQLAEEVGSDSGSLAAEFEAFILYVILIGTCLLLISILGIVSAAKRQGRVLMAYLFLQVAMIACQVAASATMFNLASGIQAVNRLPHLLRLYEGLPLELRTQYTSYDLIQYAVTRFYAVGMVVLLPLIFQVLAVFCGSLFVYRVHHGDNLVHPSRRVPGERRNPIGPFSLRLS